MKAVGTMFLTFEEAQSIYDLLALSCFISLPASQINTLRINQQDKSSRTVIKSVKYETLFLMFILLRCYLWCIHCTLYSVIYTYNQTIDKTFELVDLSRNCKKSIGTVTHMANELWNYVVATRIHLISNGT